MEATSAETEAHATLTREEEIHCHKARIFSLLANRPVVRAWKHAICDGAVYCGKRSFLMSYADRYFRASSEDISYVTFSIVTAFEEAVGIDSEEQEIVRSQCHISPAQREASEFLIVTFSYDHDSIALLPRRVYWPVEGDEGTGHDEALPDVIPASTISEYSFSITLLLANIDEVKRITTTPMHPTTTPSQIGLDGLIPRAGTPEAIMPQPSGTRMTESDQSMHASEKREEIALRIMHKQFPKHIEFMNIDFLDYQPLLRDFKIVISSCDEFPNGLEAVISHSVGHLNTAGDNDKSDHLEHADYSLTHSVTKNPNYFFFVPRRLMSEACSTAPRPHESKPAKLLDSGRRVSNQNFIFEMDDAGKWAKDVWKIIVKYPPDGHPTSAEKKREIWKKAFPWPELKAQIPLPNDSTPQKAWWARRDKKHLFSKHDFGPGDDGAVKPSDVSLNAAHYFEKASLDHNHAGNDGT
ncbi:MAG: hypothetical protein Q9175_002517 [Cornicularia normoerica]